MAAIPTLFENYISDVAVTMVFGLGYYLFKGIKNKKTTWKDQNQEIKKIKCKLEDALDRYQYAKTIEEYNELITTDYNTEDPFLVLNEMTKKGISPNIETYNALLLNCFMNGNCESAKLLYDEIVDITGPVSPNNYTLNIFIKGLNMNYNQCLKEIEPNNEKEIFNLKVKFDIDLKNVISKLNERNVSMDIISINTVIESLFNQNRLDDAWNLYINLKNIKPDLYTYLALLKGIKQCMPEITLEWYTKMIHLIDEAKYGCHFDESFLDYLLNACLKFKKFDRMEEIFNNAKDKTSISESSYAIMIKEYGKIYKLDKCLDLMKDLKKKVIKPTSISYLALLKSIIRCKKIEYIDRTIEEMKINGIELTEHLFYILINGYRNARNYDKALKLFDEILIKFEKFDLMIFNTILECCVECYKIEKMEQIFKMLMNPDGNYPKPDIMTYSLMMKGYAVTGKIKEIIEIYDEVRKMDQKLDEVLYNSLLDCFTENNDEENINKVYLDMKKMGLKIGLVTYSILLKLNEKIGNNQKCIEIYDDIVKAGIKPNREIYMIAFTQNLKENLLDVPINILRKMISFKMNPEKSMFDSMIKVCIVKSREKEAFEFALSALKFNFKFEDELYNNLVEKIVNDNKIKTQERFDFLNRLNKEVKYKGIKLNASVVEKSSKFITSNKVIKPSLYTSNSLYSSAPSNQVPVNQLFMRENSPKVPEANFDPIDETADKKKKKKKKKNKNKNKTEEVKDTEIKVSEHKLSDPKIIDNYNNYYKKGNESNYNDYYSNNDNYYCPKNFYSTNISSKQYETSVYASKKAPIIDFKRGEFYKK